MKKTTFRSNPELAKALARTLKERGVSARRKSAWICSALADMMSGDPGLNKVGLGEDRPESINTRLETITLTPEALDLVDRAYLIIRRNDPRAEGIFSELIRAAIRYGITQQTAEDTRKRAS